MHVIFQLKLVLKYCITYKRVCMCVCVCGRYYSMLYAKNQTTYIQRSLIYLQFKPTNFSIYSNICSIFI